MDNREASDKSEWRNKREAKELTGRPKRILVERNDSAMLALLNR